METKDNKLEKAIEWWWNLTLDQQVEYCEFYKYSLPTKYDILNMWSKNHTLNVSFGETGKSEIQLFKNVIKKLIKYREYRNPVCEWTSEELQIYVDLKRELEKECG